MTQKKYIDATLDAKGLNCPLPILRAKKALAGMNHGEILLIEATDPGNVKDFAAFEEVTGHSLLLSTEEDNGNLKFILMKDGAQIISEGAETLTFELAPNGRIKVGYRKSDGTVVYAENTILASGIFIPIHNEFSEILKELEEMINNSSIKENDLQRYFERHPELLMGYDYDVAIPQAIIYRDGFDTEDTWRPDFVLSPIEQEDFCKVLELKLPSAKHFRSDKSGHTRPYRELLDSINQVKDYGRAFNDATVRKRFNDKYLVDMHTPQLHLIYGRKANITAMFKIQQLQTDHGVKITSWDAALDKMKRELQ